MIQSAAMLDAALIRIRVINGCSDVEITAEDNGGVSKVGTGSAYVYTNTNAPADKNCNIFDDNGGGVTAPCYRKTL